MAQLSIKRRARFFFAVEGQSEQSFVAWLQVQSEQKVRIHLDCVTLGGGGFRSMLQRAVQFHLRRSRAYGNYKDRFLIVDKDRADRGDWSIDELRREAAKNRITVFVQNPNHEGLLLRMMPDMEREVADAASVGSKLKGRWPSYQKPMNAYALGRQFVLGDLVRVAKVDADLKAILESIGML